MKKLCLLIITVALALCLPLQAQQQSVGKILNPDGTIKAGTSGSYSAKGYKIATENGTGKPVLQKINSTFNWSTVGTQADNFIEAIAVNGTDVYAGGGFTTIGGISANRIAKWDGSTWSALGSGTTNGNVYSIAVSGTDVYVGGSFTTIGGISANRLAKWNGFTWSPLGSGANEKVFALAVQGSNIYAGGMFTSMGGAAHTGYIAKWDGSSWSAVSNVDGADGYVSTIAVNGTDVYAGGMFTSIGGVSAERIAKWDGSSWSALGTGANDEVRAIAVNGTDVYAVGVFTRIGGVDNTYYIAKWDGVTWSPLGSEANREFYAIAVSGSDVYAGGGFGIANYIAKWNGSSWQPIGSPSVNGVDNEVRCLAIQSATGSMFVGGLFTAVNGISDGAYFAKFTDSDNYFGYFGATTASAPANGTYVTGQNLDITVNFSKPVTVTGSPYLALTVGNNTAIHAVYVSGSATTALVFRYTVASGDFDANGIALNASIFLNGGTLKDVSNNDAALTFTLPSTTDILVNYTPSTFNWSALGAGANGYIYAIAVNGSDIYVGGDFTTIGGVSANHIAKWNGSNWSALGTGADADVFTIAVSGTDVYAGGYFTTIGGILANYIAKWNGSSWSEFGGADGFVYAITVHGSDVYAGGAFSMIDGVDANEIAKWDGASWSALGSGNTDGAVKAITVQGSDVYAGGDFTTIGGIPTKYIAKWNGSTWSALGNGTTNGVVCAIAVNGSDVYAGGEFTSMDGKPNIDRIAKWNGTSWSALGSGADDHVFTIAVSGSNVYAGGFFTTIGGVAANQIAKWNGSVWQPIGAAAVNGVNDAVFCLAKQSASGSMFAGGYFTAVNGISNGAYIAKFTDSDDNFGYVSPTTTGVSLPASGNFITGQNLDFTVNFNSVVTVTGSPYLTLTIGGKTVHAVYVSGSASSALVFRYTITAEDADADGIALSGSITLNGGTIQDIIGSNSTLTFTSPSTTGILVNNSSVVTNGTYVINVPTAKTNWEGGSYKYIEWKRTGGVVYGTVQIEYTTDGGATWNKVNKTPIAGLLRYSWQVPNVNSSNCKVRISNYVTKKVFDETDFPFTIHTANIAAKNYPNPFNPSTKITFGLENKSHVSLKVFNSIGQQVAELENKQLEAGTHEYEFNASRLTSGVYFYNLCVDGKSQVSKMILIK